MRKSGSILLFSVYELGQQPTVLASSLAFLRKAGFSPQATDLAVERLDPLKLKKAKFIAISVPMHTALRLGVRLASTIRKANSSCHISFFGLYAWLNQDILLRESADSIIGGEFEQPLVELAKALEKSRSIKDIEGTSTLNHRTKPYLKRIPWMNLDRRDLGSLERYVKLIDGPDQKAVGSVDTSRGCKHLCLHCPVPAVYNGRFFVVPEQFVMNDIDYLVKNGAQHITFGDPDFLNGPQHAFRIIKNLHEVHPTVTYDFTTKIETPGLL